MHRLPLLLIVCFLYFSCGNPAPRHDVKEIDSIALPDSTTFSAANSSVPVLTLPALIEVDSVSKFQLVPLDEKNAYDLLPGEFDYELYESVSVFAKTKIGNIPVLWFQMVSEGAYEESPEAIDVVMVMYDCNNRPIDVYNVAYSNLGYSFSYVRTDTVFTVDVDEMENINITTSRMAIRETGFIPEPSETVTFEAGNGVYNESRVYMDEYIASVKTRNK